MVYISTHKSSAALYHAKNMIDNWCQRNPNKKPFVHIRIMEFNEDKRRLVKFNPEFCIKDDDTLKLEKVVKQKIVKKYNRREFQVESEVSDNDGKLFIEPKKTIKLKSYSTYYTEEVIETKNRFSVLEVEGKDNIVDFAFEESNVESDLYDIIQVTTGDTVNHKLARKLSKSIFYKQSNIDLDLEKEIDKLDGLETFKIVKTSTKEFGSNTDPVVDMNNVEPINITIDEVNKLKMLKKAVQNMFVDHSRLLTPSKFYSGSEIGLRYIIKEYESLFG